MSLFGKLFGGKNSPQQPPKQTLSPPSPAPPDAPKKIKVWDKYGRTMEISREEWRTKILPGNFRNAWNKPDELANLVHGSLNDGFITDCLEPARQLHRIDSQPKRGTLYLAAILLQLKQFDEAERIIVETIRIHGEEGMLLTNLAKAYSGKGDAALAEQTLWHALELDPNQDNGFAWYHAIHRERGGDEAGLAAMQKVAALPGSWRPQLWLAREALKARNQDAAMTYYGEALSHVQKPVPGDVLMQISGDLGRAGYLPEILQLIEPRFDPAIHGLQVGNNLIKAYSDLGQLDAARRVVNQLYAQKRPDWKEQLSFWDTELTKARLAVTQPEQQKPVNSALLTINGPVWLDPRSPATELFPTSPSERVKVAFLGGTAELATNSKRIQHQMADAPGRMSRCLPLFLAEQIQFNCSANVQTFVQWILGESPGFAVCGVAWADDAAANHARQGENKNDYVVVTHLKPNQEPWMVELRLVRTIDAKCLGTLAVNFPMAKPEDGILALAQQLAGLLKEHADIAPVMSPALYQVPTAPWFASYLLRLEQLLAVRCAGMERVPAAFLSGEREIIDGNIQQCLAFPKNVCVRLLLAQTIHAMKRPRPDILPEFTDRIALLQKEQPLPEPANAIVQRILNEAVKN